MVGTPTEAIFDGDQMAYEVSYDEENRVDQVTVLKVPEPAPIANDGEWANQNQAR